MVLCENDFDTLNRLVGHERDRQTDGRTDGRSRGTCRASSTVAKNHTIHY